MRTSALLGMLGTVLCVGGCQTVPQKTLDACDGKQLGVSVDQMEQACSKAIATKNGLDGPNTAGALLDRGAAHEAKNEMDDAIADFDAALRIDPNLAPAYADRGMAHYLKGELAAAQADTDRAIALRPGDYKTYNLRCWLYAVSNEQLDTALEDCNEALRLSPGNSNVLDSLGFVQFRQGSYEKALKTYNDALNSSAGSAGASPLRLPGVTNLQKASSLFVRGLCERKLGNSAAADADLASAKTIDPNIETYYARFGVAP